MSPNPREALESRRARRQNRRKENEAPPVVVPQARLPKPRRSAFSRVFYSLFIFGAVLSFAALGAVSTATRSTPHLDRLLSAKVVQIRKGLSTPEIAAELESAGVISDANLFVAAAYVTGSRGQAQGGRIPVPANR